MHRCGTCRTWVSRQRGERRGINRGKRKFTPTPGGTQSKSEHYQRIQHLIVDETGDIWLYVVSLERTGFLRLSDHGQELGFHSVEADFDMLTARVTTSHGRLYFLAGGQDETRFYVADWP